MYITIRNLSNFDHVCLFGIIVGSFMVVNGENMEEVISFHHRKEEISDIKFSPGKIYQQNTHSHVTSYI